MFKSYISHQQREIDIDSSDEYSESDVLQTGTWSDLREFRLKPSGLNITSLAAVIT